VVTEIPWLVTKSRLIEKLADLINEKKTALLVDVRDESTDEVRIVLEPRARTVDPTIMMESLFRLTELESRISLNMNVLVDGTVPRVIGLAEALRAWLDHRRVVLQRRSRFRLGQIEKRLEILRGLLIVYLDLDKVIRIIREEDEPKPELMNAFGINEVQANAILDTRLRSLRKLEEMELRRELTELESEKTQIEDLLGSEDKQWKTVAWEIREVRKKFGPETKLGKRRTTFADAPELGDVSIEEALVEREPITVVISGKGWIRALKGHVDDLSSLSFKGDDALKISFKTETTAKILVFASNGKCFTLDGSKLPGGRGYGDPVRLMVDLEESAEIVTAFSYEADTKYLIAGYESRGFVVPSAETIGNTRKGKQLLNVDEGDRLAVVVPAIGDHVAVIGENRKLLVFPLSEVPEMNRGKGVRLQKYKDGGIADVSVFTLKEGLSWTDSAGRSFNVAKADLKDWIGHRSESGRLPPKGFPKSNKFSG
ncbi:MAG: DNA gyrase subunit A, partial [Beijerinckiaceae bacterium]